MRRLLARLLAIRNGMDPPAPSILALRTVLYSIANERLPYVFGGGHRNGKFGPSLGTNSNDHRIGLDCSGAISWALHRVGLLASPEPLSTKGLATWGLPGEGAYVTVWVRNWGGVEHAVIQIKHLHTPTEWWEAGHEGMLVGWIASFDPIGAGYSPRRRP